MSRKRSEVRGEGEGEGEGEKGRGREGEARSNFSYLIFSMCDLRLTFAMDDKGQMRNDQ